MGKKEVECMLWVLQRGYNVQMTSDCEVPEVYQLGEPCVHFSPNQHGSIAYPDCPRAKAVKDLPPLDERE